MIERTFIFIKLGQLTLHLLFWGAVLLFFTYFFGAGSENYQDSLLFSLFLMPITIATTYLSIYKLIPDYLITKRYFLFGLYSLYTLVISSYLIMVSIFFSLIYLAEFEYRDMNPITKNILLVTTAVYLVIFIVSAFKLLKLNLQQTEKTKALETKFLETQLQLKEQELKYLKLQIHPHFLFNTLNTLYGFALKKADETPEMILKLSNLLDYLLYQADKPFVSLKEEINHIKDYIALEKMRFHDTLQVTISEENVTELQQIAPMLFIPFVENSFKHGQIKNGILKIVISVAVEKGTVFFTIENSSNDNGNTDDGIGFANIRKRLELVYKHSYQLKIKNQTDSFIVNLSIPSKIPAIHA
jgi:two-component system LytT family sensor kinase